MAHHGALRPETPPPPYSSGSKNSQYDLQVDPTQAVEANAPVTLSWTPPPQHLTALQDPGRSAQLVSVREAGYNLEVTKSGRRSRDGITRVFRGPTELIGDIKLHFWSHDTVTAITKGIRRDLSWRECV